MNLIMFQGRLKLSASESLITDKFLFLFRKSLSSVFESIPLGYSIHFKIKKLLNGRIQAELKVLDHHKYITMYSCDFSQNPYCSVDTLVDDVLGDLRAAPIQEEIASF